MINDASNQLLSSSTGVCEVTIKQARVRPDSQINPQTVQQKVLDRYGRCSTRFYVYLALYRRCDAA